MPMQYTYPYPRMLVTVDAVVFHKNSKGFYEILLIKRGNSPFEGCFALPGGFPEMGELLEDAAARELMEETGMGNLKLTQLGTFDAIDRDPRDRNIAVAFYGFSVNKLLPQAGDDADDAQWFRLDKLPKLAFDHQQIIDTAIQKAGIIIPK